MLPEKLRPKPGETSIGPGRSNRSLCSNTLYMQIVKLAELNYALPGIFSPPLQFGIDNVQSITIFLTQKNRKLQMNIRCF